MLHLKKNVDKALKNAKHNIKYVFVAPSPEDQLIKLFGKAEASCEDVNEVDAMCLSGQGIKLEEVSYQIVAT